jgi:N-glycosylase/DNA lyase
MHRHQLSICDYNLAATLDSGQAFRWRVQGDAWTGVVQGRWLQLQQTSTGLLARTLDLPSNWQWLEHYLQIQVDLQDVLNSFPPDPPLTEAIRVHRGLRLLRQDPWECLATFILSSTKQIAHIKQIVERLCQRYGEPVRVPPGAPACWSFPEPNRLAAVSECDLRALGMGFRARYLLDAARRVDSERLPLKALANVSMDEARAALMDVSGVGRKIADCVLLFSLGFTQAFPVDVWVTRMLRSHWFAGQPVSLPKLVSFAEHHFGRYGGYAQQYLFHLARTEARASFAEQT